MCLSILTPLGIMGQPPVSIILIFIISLYFRCFRAISIFRQFSTIFFFLTIFGNNFSNFFLLWIFSLLLRLGKCRGRGWRRGWIRNGQEDALSTSFNHCATRLTSFAIMIMVEGPYGSYGKSLIGQMFKETIYRVSDIEFNSF